MYKGDGSSRMLLGELRSALCAACLGENVHGDQLLRQSGTADVLCEDVGRILRPFDVEDLEVFCSDLFLKPQVRGIQVAIFSQAPLPYHADCCAAVCM